MTNAKGTRLGAAGGDPLLSKRSLANLSVAFQSRSSYRSMRSMASLVAPVIEQLQLTPAELEEQFSRDLRVADPQALKNLVRLNFKTNSLVEVDQQEPIAVLINRIGRIGKPSANKPIIEQIPKERLNTEEEQQNEEEEDKPERLIRNQFNFSDRATQGYVIEYIDEGTLTEAPVPKDCTGCSDARTIAAYYTKGKESLYPPANNASVVIRIMERVVNQNMDPNACCDFKYYDDQRDAINPKEAYTLPLWEFKGEATNGFHVTKIKWNPSVNDLFAAAYSAQATDKLPSRGYVCTWTLKNHSTPRNVLELTDRATSLDWCETQPSLLAVGTADGVISIFDVRSKSTSPIFTTQKLVDRHQSAVTVLRWQPLDNSGNLNMVSAGLDGRVLQWTLVQSEMKMTAICSIPSGIVSLDYYSEASTHFIAACDDGKVYEILRTRTTEFPESFSSHSPPCLSVAYNKYHKDVFATCGTDWSIKLWRVGQKDAPLQSYDFAPHSINDIEFAPHSSTVFASVSSDGILYIYDIDLNRFEPICKTFISETNEGGLTSVTFHPKWPVVLVGDEKGRITSLKLSPNLRKNTATAKEEAERSRLAKSKSKSGSSRGLLPDLTQQNDEDGDEKDGEEDNAKREQLVADETEKFVKVMGVSWVPDSSSVKPEE